MGCGSICPHECADVLNLPFPGALCSVFCGLIQWPLEVHPEAPYSQAGRTPGRPVVHPSVAGLGLHFFFWVLLLYSVSILQASFFWVTKFHHPCNFFSSDVLAFSLPKNGLPRNSVDVPSKLLHHLPWFVNQLLKNDPL